MESGLETAIKEICQRHGNDPGQLMDIVRAVQRHAGQVSGEAADLIARLTGGQRVDVLGVVSFYAFYSDTPKGRIVIRLCNDVVDRMHGMEEVAEVFCSELDIGVGETTKDGQFSLEHTACIGMCDQAPAALINDVVVTELSRDKAKRIVAELKRHHDPQALVEKLGNGNNAHDLVQSMVRNHLVQGGPVIFADTNPGEALRKALAIRPQEVIRLIKTSRLRGRGGAGFPTGIKWEFTRAAPGKPRYVICNADEGEPGTFKDRVLLTERPELVVEGMLIAGYAIGASEGIIYLRAEYAYLRRLVEKTIEDFRREGLLGQGILQDVSGTPDFDFDIRIQMGAGAYVCGEETALISSCEGSRGDPRNRPPFPAQHGYKGLPTAVNNVETLSCVTRILEFGAAWFAQFGSKTSSGTKLLSISGDCTRPGVYEMSFGTRLSEILKLVGARNPGAVLVGGPSGQLVGKADFERTIDFDDLSTGGAIVVFGAKRDVLAIVSQYLEFFVEESCGYCTPCRVGNVLLKERVDRIRAGRGTPEDLSYLRSLGEMIKQTSRCGLGQTSPNVVLSTLDRFADRYQSLVQEATDGLNRGFDLDSAVSSAAAFTGRGPSAT